jgi:uncharacterized pyridoxamine 5'-phosphate oxidase family protein
MLPVLALTEYHCRKKSICCYKKMKNKRNLLGISACIFILSFSFTGCDAKPNVTSEKNLETRNLSEFVHILENYPNGVLANRNGENLRTQIITFSFAEGNKVYFCTTSDKPMYTQLINYPYVSYCTFHEDLEPVLSINGKVVFIEDEALKKQALESNYYAMMNFKSIDNPLLRVFCIEVKEIETFSYEGAKIFLAK